MFENQLLSTYRDLPADFFQEIPPTKVSSPHMIAWNTELAEHLHFDSEKTNDPSARANYFSGNTLLEGSTPIATSYAGHQFGHYNPMLGDGRAHLLGEIRGSDNILYDIQLKGSGPSRYSRQGDGRSPLGPVIREYIVSETMHALGVPTTRSLAIVGTGDLVYRDQPLAGGILTRVASSLTRVGTFQYFAAQDDAIHLRKLFDYHMARNYPELLDHNDPIKSFFEKTIEQQSKLVAKWMSLGFIHGVMNTDNTSAAGLTIDYGPCAFLEETDFNKVFSSIDRRGRYAYNNQPAIMQWNLERLLESLIPLYDKSLAKTKQAELSEYLHGFGDAFFENWEAMMFKKLGFSAEKTKTKSQLLSVWLEILQKQKLDYTLSFRSLSDLYGQGSETSYFKNVEGIEEFYRQWSHLLKNSAGEKRDIARQLDSVNPHFIPRNHVIEKTITDAYQKNFDSLNDILKIITNPYDLNSKYRNYTKPARESERVLRTFCGT